MLRDDIILPAQIGFIDFICMPVYETLSAQYASLAPMSEHCKHNRARWAALQAQGEYRMAYVQRDHPAHPSFRKISEQEIKRHGTVSKAMSFDRQHSSPTKVASSTCMIC